MDIIYPILSSLLLTVGIMLYFITAIMEERDLNRKSEFKRFLFYLTIVFIISVLVPWLLIKSVVNLEETLSDRVIEMSKQEYAGEEKY